MGNGRQRSWVWMGAMLLTQVSLGQCPYAAIKDRVAVCEKDYQGVIVPCERVAMRYFDESFLRPNTLSLKEVAKAEKLVGRSELVKAALAKMECSFPLSGYLRYYGGYFAKNYHHMVVVGFLYRTQEVERNIRQASFLQETSREMNKLLDDGGCRYFWVRIDLTEGKVEHAQVNGYG